MSSNQEADAGAQRQQTTPPAPPSSQEVSGISLAMRVPPFWRDQPLLWFCSFEAATAELKRSQAQLAQMVIAQLEKQDIQNIADLIYSPPEQEYYKAIKDRLISIYEESNSAQTKKLLTQVELGEQKPSQLLRRMQQLNKDKFPESTIKMMWLEHLPPHVQSVLAVSEAFQSKTTLEDLALLADKMMEVHTSSQHIAAVATPIVPPPPPAIIPPPFPAPAADTQFLIAEIRRLSLEVAELRSRPYNNQHQHTSRPRRRFQSRPRNASQSRSRKNSPMPYCFYHHRYGMDAKKCTPPCSFKPINATEN
ncbi:uncharacterized protein [Choristoneura fumiferana]|uniref:uncharacterized protein n=1 Tax=Choristoneura fumiferana TaxID=7141 RepID=UPI003D15CAB1